jgi:hypothetical protein
MAWSVDQHAAGASKARFKLARYLNDNGIYVRAAANHPPEDYDFMVAIKRYAESYSKKHPKIIYKPMADLSFADRLKGLFRT